MPISVPAKFNRNHARVAEVGYENTGEASLAYARELLGLESYADTDILDVGCGFRLAITFINRDIPVKSYTGVEVFKPLTDYLQEELTSDERFSFSHWDTENSLFNRDGHPMYMFDRFPVESPDFDAGWRVRLFRPARPDAWVQSVFVCDPV
jgi:SAM-dependent methyltransferase